MNWALTLKLITFVDNVQQTPRASDLSKKRDRRQNVIYVYHKVYTSASQFKKYTSRYYVLHIYKDIRRCHAIK